MSVDINEEPRGDQCPPAHVVCETCGMKRPACFAHLPCIKCEVDKRNTAAVRVTTTHSDRRFLKRIGIKP